MSYPAFHRYYEDTKTTFVHLSAFAFRSATSGDGGGANTAEYAFGTNPRVQNGGLDLRFTPDAGDRARGVLTYRRPVTAADVEYTINVSRDFGSFVSSSHPDAWFAVREISTVPIGDELELVSVEVRATENLPGALFFTIAAEVF